jgi:hypothetical protein
MKKYKPKIFIVILNWNGKQDTLNCLESVREIEYSNFTTLVVDNGSTDDSIESIQASFPEVEVIANGANLGYAEGNNRGITHALSNGADYIFILNNDAVVAPSILSKFVEVAENHPDAGIFGAKIYYKSEPNKIWFAGGTWLSHVAETSHDGFGLIDDGQSWEEVKEVDYVCGCTLFVKASIFRKLGLFEQKFFLTWEETDFCYKARRAGFRCLFVPSAKAWHRISGSFVGGEGGLLQQYFKTRNRLLWIERNLPLKDRLVIYIRVILPEVKSYVFVCLNPRSNANVRLKSKVNLSAISC